MSVHGRLHAWAARVGGESDGEMAVEQAWLELEAELGKRASLHAVLVERNWAEVTRLLEFSLGSRSGASSTGAAALCRQKDEHGALPLHVAVWMGFAGSGWRELRRFIAPR